MLWHRIYYVQYRFTRFKIRQGVAAASLVLLLLIGASIFWVPTLQGALEPYFATDDRLARLRSLILTLGGALIGAAAIVFAVVMFAMQINIERMPHGLFRKLSSDGRLLGAFAGTFLLAIAVATLSLIPEKTWLAVAVLGAGWGTALILLLFLYAYRRALSLINPSQQLGFVIEDARREMRIWDHRARRAAPLLERPDAAKTEKASRLRPTHDLTRTAYFQSNPHWTTVSRQAITHAISFARRYAEQGDREVSGAALSAVVVINAAYVKAKGKTFFGNYPMLDNPLSTDEFINETLEHLRQNVRIGISRADEEQIEQTFKAMAALVRVYLGIDYSDEIASRSHAHIAAAYLSDAVQSVVPHNMADVLMEGVRLMGESAQLFLVRAKPDDIATLTEKIGVIAATGIAKEDYRPITLVGVEQLARLTITLIRTERHDIHVAADGLKESVVFVAKLFLKLPDTPLSSIHSTYLAPYYSCTSTQSLPGWLTELVNALVKANSDDEAARTAIHNFEQWADGLYRIEKELFLAAIEKKSQFTLDMVFWIAHVTKLLLAVSNAPACDDHTRSELRNHALWLIHVLSRVPDDKETVAFVEGFNMTETLFAAAMDAHNHDCEEVSADIGDLLLSWAFKAGKFQTGRAVLERSVCGLGTLALVRGDAQETSRLKTAISERLAKEDAPDREIRDRAARSIRERAATLYRQDRWTLLGIEHAMGQANDEKLRPLLEEIANLLSPDTADEPVDPQIL